MNVVDSCGWLEYLADGPNACFFHDPLNDEDALLVPAITVFEVMRTLLRRRGADAAGRALGFLQRGQVLQLAPESLLKAAQASITHRLALADAMIWCTAQAHQATLYTQDADLKDLAGVRYVAKV